MRAHRRSLRALACPRVPMCSHACPRAHVPMRPCSHVPNAFPCAPTAGPCVAVCLLATAAVLLLPRRPPARPAAPAARPHVARPLPQRPLPGQPGRGAARVGRSNRRAPGAPRTAVRAAPHLALPAGAKAGRQRGGRRAGRREYRRAAVVGQQRPTGCGALPGGGHVVGVVRVRGGSGVVAAW
jgi:hypothetical protein